MAMIEERPTTLVAAPVPYVQWGAIIAGAIAAAAISFILLAFGSAIGLAFASTSPTWRDASFALWFLSGLYLVFVALASFGFGGYIAGRMRPRFSTLTVPEHEFRDGMHGVLAWGLAVLIGALLTIAMIGSAAPVTNGSGLSNSVAGESMIAFELDRLFRSDRRAADADLDYRRAEAARILLTASSPAGLSTDDHDYLVDMVSTRTGISPTDAQTRVDDVVARAKQSITSARHRTVLEAFMTAVALMLGAAAAWFASLQGGRDRESEAVPSWSWSQRRRVVV
jgi:hypothetical protein